MNDSYKEEVFNFFTQPENFNTIVKVLEHADEVMDRVIKEFWDALKERLSQRVGDHEWEIDYSDKFGHRWNKLMLYKKTWRNGRELPILAFAFENLHRGVDTYSGVFINIENDRHNHHELRKAIIDLSELKSYKTDGNHWWARWQYSSFSTQKPIDIAKLIKDDRDAALSSAEDELLNWKKTLEGQIDDLIKRYEK